MNTSPAIKNSLYRAISKTGLAAGITALFLVAGFSITTVLASAPILSITPVASVNNTGAVAVTVSNALPNSPVQFYYYPTTAYSNTYPNNYNYNYPSNGYPTSGTPIFAGTLGTTNSSGYFSVTLSSSAYNIPANAPVYILVGGQQSQVVYWPAAGYYGGSYPNPPYSYPPVPTSPYTPPYTAPYPSAPAESGSVSVGVGQSTTVYAQSGGAYTISSNSNPAVVSASVTGSTITLYGNEIGSDTVVVCPAYYAYSYAATPCASFLITVLPTLSFSQNNVTLYGIGSSQTITISQGYGSSYYGSNSYGYGSGYGNGVCASPGSAYPYNTNGYNNGGYYGYGSCGSYFIYGNSNPGAVSASVSGNTLYVYAVGYGGSTLTVCQASTQICSTVYVSVNGSTNNYYYTQPQPYYQQYQQYNYTYPTRPPYVYNAPPVRIMSGWYRRY